MDNLGSDDRVVFAFSKAVVLDIVGLRQYGDTDISVYYFAGSAWTLLENNFGSNANRNADINSGLVSSSKWAIGAVLPLADDSFKISNITFNVPVTAPPSSVPDAGGSLLLLAIGMGVLIRVQRQTATC